MILSQYQYARKCVLESGAINDNQKHDLLENIYVKIRTSGNLLIISDNFDGSGLRSTKHHARGRISEFTEGSGSRLKEYLRTCSVEYTSMVTLTYPVGMGNDGVVAKRDLKCFAQRLRRSKHVKISGLHKLSIFWFMEFQSRGAIHFHLLINAYVPHSIIARAWYEVVKSDDSRHLTAGTRIEKIRAGRHGIASYAAKYAAKQEQKSPPPEWGWLGRFWGVFGCREVVVAAAVFNAKLARVSSVSERVQSLQLYLINAGLKGFLVEVGAVKSPDGCGVRVFKMSKEIISYITMKISVIRMHTILDYGMVFDMDCPIEELNTEGYEWE